MAYEFGPRRDGDGTVFRLWAPDADAVDLEIQGHAIIRMRSLCGGWKTARAACAEGARYRFRIGDLAVPDPASRWQDGGVHGWSVVCPPAPLVPAWEGRPWTQAVMYEMHAGLAGGYGGIVRRLDELAALGVTGIQLMPIAAFPGKRNWGYDGVLPFAPADAYGSRQALAALIEQSHARDIMVLLDAVYNHFGPDGNYLHHYAGEFFRNDVNTPWGAAIDFRRSAVRTFVRENIDYWINEWRFDGLRFDAVHAIADDGWLDATVADIRREALRNGRYVHFILENEKNSAARLRNGFTAQWNDDIHHTLHVLLTDERAGYYDDYADAPAANLARALSEGFVYQGQPSRYRRGRSHGTVSRDLSPSSFVSFLQNHDQIGNREFGERLTTLSRPRALQAAVALLLLAPQVPLLFTGEEVHSKTPFLYFTDHEAELAEAVRRGRQHAFSGLFDPARIAEIPDPNAPETFAASRPAPDEAEAVSWRRFYTALLALRHQRIAPFTERARSLGARAVASKAVLARWRLDNGDRLTIACNLDDTGVAAELPGTGQIWGPPLPKTLSADSTFAWLESP
ncbi:MAG: malto-oligosyltrehalose trehalohydrolase [Alphaproteobacteria bacterium]|nr:malto-oligosyltrehalose trehalohydrolase [Alphaproteobacteria bacterium]